MKLGIALAIPASNEQKIESNNTAELSCFLTGTLPRPKGELEDIPLPMGPAFPKNRDQWTEKKALFGQNDYIGTFLIVVVILILNELLKICHELFFLSLNLLRI